MGGNGDGGVEGAGGGYALSFSDGLVVVGCRSGVGLALSGRFCSLHASFPRCDSRSSTTRWTIEEISRESRSSL